jgi:hemolysin activation/secretion protein
LAPALADFFNRDLDFADLKRMADAVAAAYRQAGWIARVYLPEQDISEGVITLQVVEAQFAGLRVEGEAPKLVKGSAIEAYFNARQAVGQPLNATALDRALLLADDLPGVSVAGTLVPGQADGETALVLQTTDEPFIYGDVGLDNTGSRSQGSDRLTLNMAINSPGSRGELVSLTLLRTRGSDYSRVALTVPAGHDGLRLGVNASALNYKVINGPGADSAVPIQGNSGGLGLALTYPMVRAREHNLYVSAALDRKSFYTSDAQVRSDYESQSLSAGLSGNRFDGLGGGGANSASVQIFRGRLTHMQAHSLKDTIGRDYNKLTYSLSRQQTLTADHSLLFSLQGQYASQLLDSSEKFYLGGAQSVRAYPASELGGERGQVLSGEWRWRLAPALVLSAFMDMGRVVALAASASDQDSPMVLRGHGLSVAWQTPMGLSTRLTWARRDGSNPKSTLTGLDGDGTLKKDRFWFTASLPF